MSMKRFKEDYKLVSTTDERGREKLKPVYRGDYYEVSLDEHGLLLFKRYCFLLFVAIAVLHIGAGFLNNPGMYQFYVVIPYAIIFFPLYFLAEGIVRVPKEKRKYRREEVELSFGHMKTASKALLILFPIVAVGELVFLLFFSLQESLWLEFVFLSAEIFATLAVYYLIRIHQPVLVQASLEPSLGE
ncbi:hypothetical protein KQH54_00035 [bacterium]|nr:hypothetical protein [bacterium]